ncbi:MAG: hypothetical protein ACRD88_18580 [Terriglobia bacterium]
MSFRLSDAEYRHLAEIARDSGANSLSAFARFAVRSFGAVNREGRVDQEVVYLQEEVDELQRALESILEIAKPRKRTESHPVHRSGDRAI